MSIIKNDFEKMNITKIKNSKNNKKFNNDYSIRCTICKAF
jgi:hypothetical protein